MRSAAKDLLFVRISTPKLNDRLLFLTALIFDAAASQLANPQSRSAG
jgi:hypothetical protein